MNSFPDVDDEKSLYCPIKVKKMADAVKVLLECMGEDPERQGLVDTPVRSAKALLFFTQGYSQTVDQVVKDAVFEEDPSVDGMVIMKDIDIWSLCEHHAVPFFGKAHIAYLPKGKILGLSKLARICEVFARRLQVQERLTKEIAQAVHSAIDSAGVGVVLECTHMCVSMRGVQKPGVVTKTSHMIGEFRDNTKTREEFLGLIK